MEHLIGYIWYIFKLGIKIKIQAGRQTHILHSDIKSPQILVSSSANLYVFDNKHEKKNYEVMYHYQHI